jgi:signal transduction histidine kinase
MLKLKTKTKIGLQFSTSVSILMIGTCLIFLLAFYFVGEKQLSEGMLLEADEIINQHLILDSGNIVYRDSENSLEYDLISDQASAVIYNIDNEIIGEFGIYELKSVVLEEGNEHEEELIYTIDEVKKSQQYQFKVEEGYFGEDSYRTLIYPIVYEGESLGVIQLAFSIDQYEEILELSLIIIAILLPISIVISFILGYLLSESAFKPISKILAGMKDLTSSNLNTSVNISGNKHDEIVMLGNTFNEMVERIKSGVERQNEFIGNASHELKNPITRAVSTLDIALEDIEEKVGREKVELAKGDLLDLSERINTLLSYAKLSSEWEINIVQVDVKEMVNFALNKLDKSIKEKNLVVDIEIEDNSYIFFSKQLFNVLIENIISNSVKYNKTNGSINVIVRERRNHLDIEIIDTGLGMSETDISHIFERFYRSERNMNSISGVGVGLSIVKSICDEHNIEIQIESVIGKGTKIELKGFNTIESSK